MSNYYVYLINRESKTIHKGVADGRSVKFDPRCNVPTARAQGEAGLDDVTLEEAIRLAREAGYGWCLFDFSEPFPDAEWATMDTGHSGL